MRALGLLAALSLAISLPAFANEAEWVSDYSNPQHSNSLNITTNPSNYHQIWEVPFQPYENINQWWANGFVIAEGKFFNSISTYSNPDKSFRNYLFALDCNSGTTMWQSQINFDFWYPAYQNGKIILQGSGRNKHQLAMYHAQTGNNIFTYPLPESMETIIPHANSAYFSMNSHTLGQYNLNTGDIEWQKSLMPGMYFSSLSLNDHHIITREFDAIRIFNIQTGLEQFKIWVPDAYRGMTSPPAPVVNNDYAFALFEDDQNSNNAMLYAFDLHNGVVKWTLPDQTLHNSLVLINKTIFSVSAGLQKINAINIDTGHIEWSWEFPANQKPVYSAGEIVATADTLFVAATDHVYGISLQTHQVIWRFDKRVRRLALGDNKLFIVNISESPRQNPKATLIAIALK